jgi:hypothetical protein
MRTSILRLGLVAAAALTIAGCSTYDRYGYGGVSIGYGGGYYSPYYAYDFDPYFGWYDGYYYPGAGSYLYDRGGSRYRWNDNQRRYWQSRRGSYRGGANWSGYRGNSHGGTHAWSGSHSRGSATTERRGRGGGRHR